MPYSLSVSDTILGIILHSNSSPNVDGKIRERLSTNNLVAVATIFFVLTTVSLGYVRWFGVIVVALAVGVAWIAILASLNVSAQTISLDFGLLKRF